LLVEPTQPQRLNISLWRAAAEAVQGMAAAAARAGIEQLLGFL
jgi:hypothetical protein